MKKYFLGISLNVHFVSCTDVVCVQGELYFSCTVKRAAADGVVPMCPTALTNTFTLAASDKVRLYHSQKEITVLTNTFTGLQQSKVISY